MLLSIDNIPAFSAILKSISKFIDRARFDFSADGMRIRSIDSEDFCYIDLGMNRSFFSTIADAANNSLILDVSILGEVMKTMLRQKRINLRIEDESLSITTPDESLAYRLSALNDDYLDQLPDPQPHKSDIVASVQAARFLEIVKGAMAINKEVRIAIINEDVILSAVGKNASYKATLEATILNGKKGKHSTAVFGKYIKAIEPLVKKVDEVELRIGVGIPAQLTMKWQEAATLSYSLSPRKAAARTASPDSNRGESLPQLTASRFPKYVLFLSTFPNGVELLDLRNAGLESSGSDYSRMASKLNFVKRRGPNLILTESGAQFASLLKYDKDTAKHYLHSTLIKEIPAYRILVGILGTDHKEASGLFQEIRAELEKQSLRPIDSHDFSTITGLATWCGRIDKRLGTIFGPARIEQQ